jgi:hypothetical protein
MSALIILTYLFLLLCPDYARTDVTIPVTPVCKPGASQTVKQGGSSLELSILPVIEAEEDDDDDFSKKYKYPGTSSKLSHTIVVSHLYKCFHNRLPVFYPAPCRYLLLSRLRI